MIALVGRGSAAPRKCGAFDVTTYRVEFDNIAGEVANGIAVQQLDGGTGFDRARPARAW